LLLRKRRKTHNQKVVIEAVVWFLPEEEPMSTQQQTEMTVSSIQQE
jgi:hypothetical protein